MSQFVIFFVSFVCLQELLPKLNLHLDGVSMLIILVLGSGIIAYALPKIGNQPVRRDDD